MIRTGKWLGITTAVPGGAIGAGVAFAKEVKDPSLWKIARGAGRFWSARVVLLLTIGGSAAGYLGYYIGYNDEQDYENSTFLSVIGEKVYYQSIAKYFKVCESLAHLIHRNIIQDMSAKAKIAMPDNSRVIYVARGRDDDVGLNNRELKKKRMNNLKLTTRHFLEH